MGEVPAATFTERAVGRLPRWAAVTLGIVASVVGIVLATRPFRSLAVLVIVVVLALVVSGIVDLATPTATRQRWLSLVRGLAQVAAAARCLSERGVIVSIATALLLDRPVWRQEPTTGPFAVRLAENSPTGPITAPLLIGQGTADTLITSASQAAFVGSRCGEGQPVDYRAYTGRDHVGLMAEDSPAVADLVAWTEQRFSGAVPTDTCP